MKMNWLLWRSPEDAVEWGNDCGKNLSRLLGPIIAGLHSEGAVEVILDLPSPDKARIAWKQNIDLFGELNIRLKKDPGRPLKLHIPLPYHGVFLARRQDSARPLSLVWNSWLGEAPGFRLVRPTSFIRRTLIYSSKREEMEWRIGLPRGYFVGARCREIKDLSEVDAERLSKQKPRFLCEAQAYPEWLRTLLGNYGPTGSSYSKRAGQAWKEIHQAVIDRTYSDEDITDQDDLDHRILVTFPVWLKGRLCDELLRAILSTTSRTLAGDVQHALLYGDCLEAENAERVWSHLIDKTQVIASRLVPLRRIRISNQESVDRVAGLHFVDPTNPVDLAARLTSVRRLMMSRRAMAEIPAEFRQNHPTFQGCLCPVESPESELVGLSLQFAQGATIASDGQIHPSTSAIPIKELGYGAGLIPFFQNNDGTRSMMGAKNLRQVLPASGRKAPVVRTGGEEAVSEMTRRLIELGICPSSADENGELALGIDLLVAYLPWFGMNFEDAIVVGQHVVDSGVLDAEFTTLFRRRVKVGWEPHSGDPLAIFQNDENGLARPGEILIPGSAIARLANSAGTESSVIVHKDRSPAVLRSITFNRREEWMTGILEYELLRRIPLSIGDKLMGRHGNKGVVGTIVAKENMPRLPDIEALPKAFRGRAIDVLLNPHGVISRMNVGQLLETHIGWLLYSGICSERDLLKTDSAARNPIGCPFDKNIDHIKIRTLLEKTGLDKTGRIRLVLPSGEMTLSPVAVGFQHIVRLRHIPELKSQARRGGKDALYSRKTGQAVHGRIRGGGQRVGEMEVWALAGYSAEHVLEEMLGVKADAGWAARWLPGNKPPTGDLSNGFPALFHDWLYSLLIKVDANDGQVKLSFATGQEVVERIGKDRLVKNGHGIQKLTAALFSCKRGKSEPCGYKLPIEGQIAVDAASGKDGDIPSLKVGDLLRHLGLRTVSLVSSRGKEYRCRLESVWTRKNAGLLLIDFEAKRDQIKAVIRPGSEKDRPVEWPRELDKVFAYGRFVDSAGGGNIDATVILEQLLDPSGDHQIGDLSITCPQHKTVPLRASPPFGEVLRAEPEGLFDSAIFGPLGEGGGSWSDSQWGLIELPIEVCYPLHVFLAASQSKEERQDKVAKFLEDHSVCMEDVPKLRIIPVLPSRYRMPLLITGEPIDDDLVKKGYQPLIEVCNRYRNAESEEQRSRLLPGIEGCVATLFSLLTEALRNKTGLIRRHGLGRRIDRSARLVIVPNPSLRWDQVGVPAAVLLELLGDQIQVWLEKSQRSKDLLELIKTTKAREANTPELEKWSWWRSSKDEELIGCAKKLLDEYLAENPDLVVLLNRQPSLHRDSFQAFHPLAVGPEAGDALQICPLSCKGFGADFDGDEMVIHCPVSKEAQEEARRLMPSRNLFSLASGKVIAHYDQDFVMGSYWINDIGPELRDRFRSALPYECCRDLVKTGRIGDRAGSQLLDHLAHTHPDLAADAIWKWMNAAFECCTRVGVSFGFYDLVDLHRLLRIEPEVFAGKTRIDDLEGINSTVQKFVEEVLIRTVPENPDWTNPGIHFAAMALSGARGRKQTRQIIGARGFLAPGSVGFEITDFNRFVLANPLVAGMSSDEAFWAAMNSRSSMCDKKLGTGQAGDLTRHLVFALWPFQITCEDCGLPDSARGILTCKAHHGCCSLCYGRLPNGTLPAIGFPAGLIAAQSIGERGTQLSMQSFHTGTRAFTISDVRQIVGHGDDEEYFDDLNGAKQFVAALKSFDAYRALQDRHFQILWRVIHSSPEHSIQSAIQQLAPLTRVAFQRQAHEILASAISKDPSSLAEPAARVLYGLFGARCELIEKR